MSKAPSAVGSGSSTPYGHGTRSALSSSVLVEEEEEEVKEVERIGGGFGLGFSETDMSRLRTVTRSTVGSTLSGTTLDAPSTALTTPDMGSLSSPHAASSDSAALAAPTALQPVTALATSDAELQLGLAKVAEPDVDAFMSFIRLEGMLVEAIV